MTVDGAALPGYDLAYQGKVRDLHVPEGATLETADVVLMVASDRVSAFDHALEPPIPGKGATLTAMTTWWLRTLGDEAQLAGDHGPGALEVVARGGLLRRLVEGVVDLLPVDLADDVERRIGHATLLVIVSRAPGGLPERSKGADCKSVGTAYEGSNPSPATSTAKSP